MTAIPARQVRRLRLAAPEESLVRRGRTLIEDALRTASLPGVEPGRVLVVRHLDLGAIHGATAPSSIAMLVEKRLAEARLHAVHVESPAAAAAPAVYFRHRAEPFVVLALRLATRADVSSWYWPLVIPGWRPHLRERAAWSVLLGALSATDAAPISTLEVVTTLEAHGALDQLLEVLHPSDGLVLLAACGWSPPVASAPLSSVVATVLPSRPWRYRLHRWLPRWGQSDPRTAWLAAVAIAVDHPAAVANPYLPTRALAVATQLTTMRKVPLPPTLDLPRHVVATHEPSSDGDNVGQSKDREPDEVEHVHRQRRYSLDPQLTDFGGFYFLLPILYRLHLDALLEERPELLDADFPNHLLRYAADRLGVPPDDPVRLPLEGSPLDGDLLPLIKTWFGAMRLYVRHHARIGLVTLTRRNAMIEVSRTHIDVSFNLHHVDMRVRRAGLDFDPGWIAWLGHVVLFHYVEAQPSPL